MDVQNIQGEEVKVVTPEELEKKRVKDCCEDGLILSGEIAAILFYKVADNPLVSQKQYLKCSVK